VDLARPAKLAGNALTVYAIPEPGHAPGFLFAGGCRNSKCRLSSFLLRPRNEGGRAQARYDNGRMARLERERLKLYLEQQL
jgi:hypothetical protein